MLSIWSWAARFLRVRFCTRSLATICEGALMIFDYVLGGAVTLGLLVYLVYALIRPERF
jgi:K+-transporting ATPase KdpF subunit